MKLFFLLEALLLSVFLGQAVPAQITIRGQVLDTAGQAVPYVNIGIPGKEIGTASYEDGRFVLKIMGQHISDTLSISAIGYQKRRLAIRSLDLEEENRITLDVKVRKLDQVTILPVALDSANWGYKARNSWGTISNTDPEQGMEVATLIRARAPLFRVDWVEVPLGSMNLDEFQIRCRFYSLNKEQLPDSIIFFEDLIQTTTISRGKIRFSFENTPCWLSQDFYVAFEWIRSREQTEELFQFREKYPIPFVEEYEAQFPEAEVQVMNNRRIRVVSSEGEIIFQEELSKEQKKYLLERKEFKPRVYFQTQSTKGKSCFRGVSLGTWIPHTEVIGVAVQVSFEKAK